MVSHWSLSENKYPQVSRTLLSILADLNNAVVLIVSILPVISKSSSPCTKPLVTVQRAPISNGIIVTFMFHSLFNFLASSYILLQNLLALLHPVCDMTSPIFPKLLFRNSLFCLFCLVLSRYVVSIPSIFGWSPTAFAEF